MTNFNPLRKNVADWLLKKELKKQQREPLVSNLSNAVTVGILFYAEDEKTYKTVKGYVQQLKDGGVNEVKAIGYVHQKELPDYLMSKLEFDFFTKKQLNWQLQPTAMPVKRFIKTPYDIIIDLTTETVFPLKYVLANSTAKFKVGKQTADKTAILDLMIEMPNAKPLSYLISQLNHYLQMINKSNNEQSV